MAKCLYTYVDLNEHVPADDRTATREHIVPYALGGSDAFAIKYCSKKANNDLGRDIDAPFIALPLVGFKRHSLGLKSYSGTVPDIVFKGECEELKKTCSIIFPYQKPVYADFEPEVQGGIGEGRISFAGSEDRLSHAVNSLIKKARRNGLTLLGNVGQQLGLIANVDDAMRVAVRSTGETLHFQMDFGMDAFAIPWSRGLIKIALGLGAYALGESWAFSAAADNLRSCLICNANSLKDMPLLGTTVGRIAPEIAKLINVQPGKHTLAVLPFEKDMVACISLFGGEIFDGIINLGSGPADIKLVNDTLPAAWECVFQIDPATRSFTTRKLADIDRTAIKNEMI